MLTAIVVLALVGAYLLPIFQDHLPTLEELYINLPPTYYEQLCEYALGRAKEYAPEFWEVSKGLRGIAERFWIASLHIQVAQGLWRQHRIMRDDAFYVWLRIIGQALLSIGSIIEAPICRIFGCRHVVARKSLVFYCEIILQTNTLWENRKCHIISP